MRRPRRRRLPRWARAAARRGRRDRPGRASRSPGPRSPRRGHLYDEATSRQTRRAADVVLVLGAQVAPGGTEPDAVPAGPARHRGRLVRAGPGQGHPGLRRRRRRLGRRDRRDDLVPHRRCGDRARRASSPTRHGLDTYDSCVRARRSTACSAPGGHAGLPPGPGGDAVPARRASTPTGWAPAATAAARSPGPQQRARLLRLHEGGLDACVPGRRAVESPPSTEVADALARL